MEGKPLSSEQIQNLLANKKSRTSSTEPRTVEVWFKQDHLFREDGCDNNACTDPRPSSDRGRRIVVKIGDNYVCRFCFLGGWLSPNDPNA
jgi:hypothetical protein